MARSTTATSFVMCLIALLSLSCSNTHAQVVYNSTVYVDNTNKVANDSAVCGSSALPCRTISFALKYRTLNSTQIAISSGGHYVLHESITVANLTLVSVTSTGIGQSEDGAVTVECGSGAGLSFVWCTNVTLHGLTLFNCSALQNSTSRNFNSTDFAFMQFPVALYILFCQNTNLTGIKISNSNTGLAVLATGGSNYFCNCTFSNNGSPDDDTYPSGGGMYIEFPFCDPQIPEQCRDGSIITQSQFFINVEYKITHCRFEENTAHMWHPIEFKYLLPQLTNHLSFGNGGGLSVFFSHANNSMVTVTDSSFRSNGAERGGGVSVEFQEMSWNNKFVMESCVFQNNTAITNNISVSKVTGGGGMSVGYIFLDDSRMGHNSVMLTKCSFQNNIAFWGGGVLFSAARENRVQATNSFILNNCTWFHNLGRVGSALDLSVWAPFVSGSTVVPRFINCNFTQNNDIFTSQVLSPLNEPISVGTISTHSIPILFESSTIFESNNRSAIVSTDASLNFMENCSANFTGNCGRSGGAIFLSGSAFLRVHHGTNMTFTGNVASQFGGAIYYSTVGQHELILFGYCFIQFADITLHPTKWTASFFFRNNTAGYEHGGDSIYATSLVPCLWMLSTPSSRKSIPDPHKQVFCWNDKWQYSDSDCEKQVSSSPATYDNGSRYHMELILGKRQIMPIEVLDDKLKNQTPNAIFNIWSHSPDVAQIPRTYTYVSDNTISLYGKPNSSATLAVETINPRVIYTEVRVKIVPCPPGFKLSLVNESTQCVCNGEYGNVLLCNQGDFVAKLRRGLWIGEDPFTRDVVVGMYPYIAAAMKEPYIQLPNSTSKLDELFCAPVNRTGAFCGECMNGYTPAINSKLFSCVKCSHDEVQYNWAFFILLEILPITIFFFLIIFFHISVTRGAGNSFVFFAQLLTTTFDIDADGSVPVNMVTSLLRQVYEVMYGFWNLNFFSALLPDFCLALNWNTLTVLSFHYIPAIYFLILIPIFYSVVWLYERGIQPVFCLCKPVHRFLRFFQRRWNLNRSMIDAFSTFLVLSYTKFTVVSVYLLTPSTLIFSHGPKVGSGLYFQGNIRYLSRDHAPFFVVAMFVMIIFVILPPLLLLVYPLRLVEKLAARLGYHGDFFKAGRRMHLFLDTFQGCFKDGTNGTRDCRYFAGLYFILRTILFAAFAYGGIWIQQYVIQQLVCTLAILLFTTIRPYKKDFYNNLDAVMLGILAMINALSIYNIYFADVGTPLPNWGFAVQYVLIYCPLLYMTCYVVWKAVKLRKQCLIQCLRRCLGRNLSERTALLSDVLNTSSEASVDEEYRHFADQVEAFGRDRERNYYKPKTTETSGYGASNEGTAISADSISSRVSGYEET